MNERTDVQRLVSKYDTRNPFELARFMGRVVMFVPLAGTRGFYQYYNRRHLIYVDDELEEMESNFVCAHELAHSIYHYNINAVFLDSRTHFVTGKYERTADRFAIDLVVSDEMAYEIYELSSYQLAKAWKISEDIVRYRFSGMQMKFFL